VLLFVLLLQATVFAQQDQYLGKLSRNRYDAESVSNPYASYGSPYSPTSVNNQFGVYGSPSSPLSVTNPYTVSAPRLYASDGTYLGRLSANRFDSESTSNRFGRYGSPFSPTSITNRFSPYGSLFGPLSASNPYAIRAPRIVGGYGRP